MEETETTTTTESTTTWDEVAAASAAAAIDADARPPRRFEQELPCKLSDDELRGLGDSLEKALANIDTLTEEKKLNAASFKARIELAKEKVGDIRESLRSKTEIRDVECLEHFEYRLGVARVTRVDTGEIISERALTGAERQPSLPGVSDAEEDELDSAPADTGSTPFDDEDDSPSIEDPQAVLDGEPAEVAAKKRARRSKKASS